MSRLKPSEVNIPAGYRVLADKEKTRAGDRLQYRDDQLTTLGAGGDDSDFADAWHGLAIRKIRTAPFSGYRYLDAGEKIEQSDKYISRVYGDLNRVCWPRISTFEVDPADETYYVRVLPAPVAEPAYVAPAGYRLLRVGEKLEKGDVHFGFGNSDKPTEFLWPRENDYNDQHVLQSDLCVRPSRKIPVAAAPAPDKYAGLRKLQVGETLQDGDVFDANAGCAPTPHWVKTGEPGKVLKVDSWSKYFRKVGVAQIPLGAKLLCDTDVLQNGDSYVPQYFPDRVHVTIYAGDTVADARGTSGATYFRPAPAKPAVPAPAPAPAPVAAPAAKAPPAGYRFVQVGEKVLETDCFQNCSAHQPARCDWPRSPGLELCTISDYYFRKLEPAPAAVAKPSPKCPPSGYRWLAVGEKFESTDAYIGGYASAGKPFPIVWPRSNPNDDTCYSPEYYVRKICAAPTPAPAVTATPEIPYGYRKVEIGETILESDEVKIFGVWTKTNWAGDIVNKTSSVYRRSVVPAGHRLLGAEEVLVVGDQYWNNFTGATVRTCVPGATVSLARGSCDGFVYFRKVEAETRTQLSAALETIEQQKRTIEQQAKTEKAAADSIDRLIKNTTELAARGRERFFENSRLSSKLAQKERELKRTAEELSAASAKGIQAQARVTELEKSLRESAGFKDQADAWVACYRALVKGTGNYCIPGDGSGQECAVREIARLQQCAADLKELQERAARPEYQTSAYAYAQAPLSRRCSDLPPLASVNGRTGTAGYGSARTCCPVE